MSLKVEVAGLDVLVPPIEEGTTIVVEGGADLAKSFFVRRLCRTARHVPRPVAFVTSQVEQELRDRLALEDGGVAGAHETTIVERDALESLVEFMPVRGVLAVDSFSFLTLDLSAAQLARLLRDGRRAARDRGSIIVLTTETGMADPRATALLTHLAEGLIEFRSQEGPEGLVRFLRVPKWSEGRFIDRNVYYSFDGQRLAVDLRNRVL